MSEESRDDDQEDRQDPSRDLVLELGDYNQRCVALYCSHRIQGSTKLYGFDVWEFARNVRFFHESWLKSYILHHKPDIGEKLNVNADKLKGIIDRNQLQKPLNDDMLDGDLSRLSQFHNKFAHHQFRQRYTPSYQQFTSVFMICELLEDYALNGFKQSTNHEEDHVIKIEIPFRDFRTFRSRRGSRV